MAELGRRTVSTPGDARPKRRPKDPQPRPHVVAAKFSDEEHALLSAACDRTGLAPGAYVALAVLEAAKADIGTPVAEFTITWPERSKDVDEPRVDFDDLQPGESVTITRNRQQR